MDRTGETRSFPSHPRSSTPLNPWTANDFAKCGIIICSFDPGTYVHRNGNEPKRHHSEAKLIKNDKFINFQAEIAFLSKEINDFPSLAAVLNRCEVSIKMWIYLGDKVIYSYCGFKSVTVTKCWTQCVKSFYMLMVVQEQSSTWKEYLE